MSFNSKYYDQKLNPISGELNMTTKRFVGFEDIVLASNIGSWDFSKGGYNKRVEITTDNDITLTISKLKNGMIGTLLVSVGVGVTNKAIILNITDPTINDVNGNISGLSEGEYIFVLVCFDDGEDLKLNVREIGGGGGGEIYTGGDGIAISGDTIINVDLSNDNNHFELGFTEDGKLKIGVVKYSIDFQLTSVIAFDNNFYNTAIIKRVDSYNVSGLSLKDSTNAFIEESVQLDVDDIDIDVGTHDLLIWEITRINPENGAYITITIHK